MVTVLRRPRRNLHTNVQCVFCLLRKLGLTILLGPAIKQAIGQFAVGLNRLNRYAGGIRGTLGPAYLASHRACMIAEPNTPP